MPSSQSFNPRSFIQLLAAIGFDISVDEMQSIAAVPGSMQFLIQLEKLIIDSSTFLSTNEQSKYDSIITEFPQLQTSIEQIVNAKINSSSILYEDKALQSQIELLTQSNRTIANELESLYETVENCKSNTEEMNVLSEEMQKLKGAIEIFSSTIASFFNEISLNTFGIFSMQLEGSVKENCSKTIDNENDIHPYIENVKTQLSTLKLSISDFVQEFTLFSDQVPIISYEPESALQSSFDKLFSFLHSLKQFISNCNSESTAYFYAQNLHLDQLEYEIQIITKIFNEILLLEKQLLAICTKLSDRNKKVVENNIKNSELLTSNDLTIQFESQSELKSALFNVNKLMATFNCLDKCSAIDELKNVILFMLIL